jgi:V/A-type H+-transporting ATPase subunit C
MLLRSYYEEYLYEAVRKDFTGASKMQLSNIIMAQVDLINIINIYRMKNYFGMSPEEIHANILHVKGRLSSQVEESLVNAESAEAFLKILARTSYGGQLEDMKEFNAIYFENKLSRLRVRMSRRALGTSQSAAVSIYCALYLLEIEIQNIILIIEGVRYGKPQSYLEELVIQF